ncbi:MAG: hypothetical protein ACI35P_07515 [Bacillus sp. (in: firmicutes)]
MTTKIIRSFAAGILLATGVCGAVYFFGSSEATNDDQAAEQVTVKPTEEEMKSTLTSNGYVVLTEEELQKQLAAAEAKKEESSNTQEQTETDAVVYRTMITVTSGMTSIDLGDALVSAKIISSRQEFVDAVEKKGLVQNLRPGTFEVQSDMTLDEVISALYKQ